MKVLLAGAHTRSGLAVARSLARQGVPLVALGTKRIMALRSRLVRSPILAPPAVDDPEGYFQLVCDVAVREGAGLIIPFSDSDVVALAFRRDRIPSGIRVALPSAEAVAGALDKRVNLRLARDLDIPCPLGFDLEHTDQIPEMIARIGFPVVLKPPGMGPHGSLMRFPKVVYAHDESELRACLDRYCSDGRFPIVQKLVTGRVHNVCCFAVKGEVVALHEYHSMRRCRGQGVMRRITPARPDTEQHARAMLRALNWEGVAHVGFFIDDARGELRYMETNGRFWGSVQGSIDAGWNFPCWVYRYFAFGEPPQPGPLRIGSKTCWHCGDLEALVTFLRGGEVPATGTNPSRVAAARAYLSAFRPGVHSDVWDLRDPAPALYEHAPMVRKLGSFLLGRRRRRRRRRATVAD